MKKEFKEKRWIVRSEADGVSEAAVTKLASELGVNPITARLLYIRGYKDYKSAKSFLNMEKETLHNPFAMADMERATERIEKALVEGERIVVYGDYDVDGVTSVCTLYLYLKSRGADIGYYIPNRSGEGYGVSNSAISQLKEAGASLIITVDTGITAVEEVAFARSIGVDFVITDHHECRPELPEASAVVNPHRPDCKSGFKDLAGVGVVFKLITAMEMKRRGKRDTETVFDMFSQYADLVAIGTIADVMPIKGENRLIVSYGLKMMQNTGRVGLMALIEAASGKNEAQRMGARKKAPKITSSYIGYTIAPRINAAGRVRSASMAVELFLSDNYDDAYKIAEELCLANKDRQDEENSIMKEVYKKIEKFGYDKMPVIVIDSDHWHHGVIGIVSSRITEKYCKPSILVSFEGNDPNNPSPDDVGKGSGRSVKGMNLVDALFNCEEYLVKFGGHELAAGLSVTRANLDKFREKINEYATRALPDESVFSVEADVEINPSDISLELAEELRILEPYGVSNPVPSFVTRSVVVTDVTGVSDGKHTRLGLDTGALVVSAMYFSNSPESLGISVGDRVDILYNLDINEWAGRRSPQVLIRDVKEARSEIDKKREQSERFERIWNGERFSRSDNILPTRDDFAALYRLIVGSVRAGVDRLTLKELLHRYSRTKPINYVKMKIMIKVMQELNLIGIEEVEEDTYRFSVYYKSTKTDLEKSNLLRRLRNQQD